jgi:hypothetical protein
MILAPANASGTPIVLLLEPLSQRERGRGEGRGSSCVNPCSLPHLALRATFSRGEKGKQRRLDPLFRRQGGAQSPKWGLR